jgi:membrane associated rhomboid family serine protease
MNMTDMVKHLLIINIIFFIGSYLMPGLTDVLALHYFESDKFRLWQPITHMFMHGSPMHIFFNMFALVSFGSTLEQMWGGKKFLFFYFSCGLGAALLHAGVNYLEFHYLISQLSDLSISSTDLHTMLNTNMSDGLSFRADLLLEQTQPLLEKYNFDSSSFSILFQSACQNQATVVGASGAIYGLLAGFAFLFPNAELALMFIPVPIKAKYFVPAWILLFDISYGIIGGYLGFSNSGFGHFAHVGGALTGLIIVLYWKKNQFNKNRWDR